MSLVTKVCGVRTAEALEACAAAGASFVGLNRVDGRRRQVTLALAVELVAACPAPLTPVLLYQDAPLHQVVSEARAAGVTWVQLHGVEPPAMGRSAREAGLRVIKALPGLETSRSGQWRAWVDACDVLLLDGRDPGSGERWAWGQIELTDGHLGPLPVWLAGGLTPLNVGEAVATVRPIGVDVASGVERAGSVDGERVTDFVAAAVSASHERGQR